MFDDMRKGGTQGTDAAAADGRREERRGGGAEERRRGDCLRLSMPDGVQP